MYHPNSDPSKFSLGSAGKGSNSNSSSIAGGPKAEMHGFMNEALLLGQSGGFAAGSPNLNILGTPNDRIPSIASMASGGGNYPNFHNSFGGARVMRMANDFRGVVSDSKELNLYARAGIDSDLTRFGDSDHPAINDAGYTGYHTLGQMADQFQERARADKKHNSDYGDDEDEDEEDDNDHSLIPQGNESTGRWTRQEHELFLEALKKYGKEWKKVASMVKTRTVVQTRTHAQKYFQKVTKSIGGGSGGGMGHSTAGGGGYSDDEGGMDLSTTASARKAVSGGGGFGSSAKKGRRVGGNSNSVDVSPYSHHYLDSDEVSAHQRLSSYAYGMGSPGLTSAASGLGLLNSGGRGGTAGGGGSDAYGSTGNFSMDENSLDRDSMVLSELHHMTPSGHMSAFKNSLINPNSISHDNLDGMQGFPQPSPAACGKRKHAELQAAQMLASSSNFEMEGAQVLTMLKDDSGRKRPTNLSLSILNPEPNSAYENAPSTPWDSELRALEARSAGRGTGNGNGANSASSSTTSASAAAAAAAAVLPIATPSEQKNFIAKVRSAIQNGDIAGLREVLEAAELSAQSYVNSGGKGISNNNSSSAANLMSVFSTPNAAVERTSSTDGADTVTPSAVHQYALPGSASARRTPAQSLVARSLNRSDKREKSVLMDVICLDVARYSQSFMVEMCNVLMDNGASAALTDANNFTALHYAAEKGLETVGRALLVKGCPINVQNADGDAATHIAARLGHGSFLDLLADFGANFHLRNNQASCALDLAGAQSKDPGERAVIRRLMLSKEPRLRTLILYHDDCLEHTARKSSDWEGPDRLLAIMKRLRDRKEFPEFELEISSQFEKASVVLLSRAHSPEYLSFVNKLSTKLNGDTSGSKDIPAPPVPFTPQVQRFVKNQTAEELKRDESCDTSFSVGTLTAARRAAGAVAHAVDCVLLGRNRNVFCVVRPPGHHAGYSGLLDGGYSCGFCIFNSVAAGALHALEEHNCERVAIIDLDVHHGNGTEDIVRRYPQPSRLFFFSVHLFDKELSPESKQLVYQFYPGSGDTDDNIHNIINVPMTPLWKDDDKATAPHDSSNVGKGNGGGRSTASSSPVSTSSSSVKNEKLSIESLSDKKTSGTSSTHGKTVSAATLFGREAYRQAILQRLIPSLRAFNPDLILMSSGFDAAAGDVGNMRNFPGRCERGMDLSSEDFEWATAEVMKIADLCCSGKLVSVLEGGYGEYERPTSKGASRAPSARLGTRHGGNSGHADGGINNESAMNRDLLAASAVAHVHRLIDPYGPSRSTSSSGGGSDSDFSKR